MKTDKLGNCLVASFRNSLWNSGLWEHLRNNLRNDLTGHLYISLYVGLGNSLRTSLTGTQENPNG